MKLRSSLTDALFATRQVSLPLTITSRGTCAATELQVPPTWACLKPETYRDKPLLTRWSLQMV